VRGRPLIERQIETLRGIFDRILLATQSPQDYGYLNLETIEDVGPGQGAMVGIYSGLLAVQGRAGFFVACDMPFLNEGLIRFIVDLSRQHDVVIPQTSGGLEPVHATYSKACLAPMKAQMAKGDFKIINFFSQVRTRIVTEEEVRRFDPSCLALMNINTVEDYRRYFGKPALAKGPVRGKV
jgi:molybdopterin-guanine dinucleotide biosynthesis protein A